MVDALIAAKLPDGSAEATAVGPADAEAEPVTDSTAWTYTVSVRGLCEFTAKQGDLDRRFTPSATALEGRNGQAMVTARRGQDYESEVALEGVVGLLRVRGRVDGHDPRRRCLEEIKTIRGTPEDIPENRRRLHWAQLQTYGALWCRSRGADEIDLALVYVDALTLHETVLRERCAAADLEADFVERCGRFAARAAQEAAHRRARDRALTRLPFPQGSFRPGQRGLAEAVYRAAVAGRSLLAQAPTGIGKTIGTLYPLLRAMPGQRLDKIAYLTCKGTGRIAALEALAAVRQALPTKAPPLRVLVQVAKDQACEHPDKACHGESCPLAAGFYDRLPAARAEAVAAGWLDAAAQRQAARDHGICPYYLGQELLRWADVVVGDVHHLFDPNGQLHGLSLAQGWRMGVLVDEAHNLLERARRMYSAELSLAQIKAARQAAPASLRPALGRLLRAARELADAQTATYAAKEEIPAALTDALQAVVIVLAEYLQLHPLTTGVVLNFHFLVLRFQQLADSFARHSVFDIERGDAGPPTPGEDGRIGAAPPDAGTDTFFRIRNVVPAGFLRPRFEACRTTTLFSATLGPPRYLQDLLGLREDTAWIDVPPVFPPGNLVVRIADRVSTRFRHRAASLDALVDLLARQFQDQPGNYLAFFSSFHYADQAAARLALRHPQVAQWSQSRTMDEDSRREFLARFAPDGRGIGFAVLGGSFSEGIDLPGSRLIGAFVATLGLPPPTPVQQQFKARLDAIFGAGHGYADLVPGMQRVIQAAGRVLRTPEDRGWLWLIDDRYRRPAVQALLPAWWGLDEVPAEIRPSAENAGFT
jgi:Rad3-related DNA helicase